MSAEVICQYLFPKVKLKLLPRMFGVALVGAFVGGCYGVLHDQITYSISHEYFTKLKFDQFQYANFGFPPRIFVAEVGFIAVWWVGLFSAWFLARIAVPTWPTQVAFKKCLLGFLIIFGFAFLASSIGYLIGLRHSDYPKWRDFCEGLGVVDIPAFVRVAYIHNAGYLGGFIGLVSAIIILRRMKRNYRN